MKSSCIIKMAIIIGILCMNWTSGAIASAKVPVFVSIVPQKYFVKKIGGDLVDISIMVQPGASPATYEPKPKQMVALSIAKIYFAIGVPFEKAWLKKISAANPKMLVVHTEAGIEKRPMKAHHHPEGEEHHEGEDHHGIKDPHVWLSTPLVKILARNILQGLLEVDPVHSSDYEANYKKFIVELDDLDAEIRGIFAGKGNGMEFMVFHPAWGYFADVYGLHQVPIEIEGKDPKPAQLKHLIEHAKEHGIKVIFVQPQFSIQSAETIANAIGGEVVFANPLALDWANNIRKQAAKFKEALR